MKKEMQKLQQKSRFDAMKWTFVVLLVLAGITMNYFYAHQPVALRLVAWILLTCVVAFIASKTDKGEQAVSFAKQSKMELRKVVWPTRQEVVQTTMIVVVVVLIVSLLLWGIDALLLRLIGLLTGLEGKA